MRKQYCMAVMGVLAAAILPVNAADNVAPAGYWNEDRAAEILDKTVSLRLAPDLSALEESERNVVRELLAAGLLLHELYLEQNHHQALPALKRLLDLDAGGKLPASDELLRLFRLFKGPIATTLSNDREPFLPVDDVVPGKNVYPWGASREEIDSWMERHDGAELLAGRSIVRRASRTNARKDLQVLQQYPVLEVLHPKLAAGLREVERAPDDEGFYSLPYPVAYAAPIMRIYAHLRNAADAAREQDRDFAAYLENRARDLLTNDYEAGDASWVSGRFGRLNAQIGSYETYDDELYGAKTFFSLSLLLKDAKRSKALQEALGDLQSIEDALPYERHKKVRTDIPVGVYEVIADFGQARGSNTATILPNDPDHARKYGRTILMRHNILTNEALFEDTLAGWRAAVVAEHADDLTMEAGFQRTLWHEVGHYLGVATDVHGRDLDVALQEYSDLFEEMKSDLVSLHAATALQENGYYTSAQVRALYADGVRRTLQRVRPRREQPYQTMQLMQMNYFLEHGLLSFDEDAGRLRIHYDNYHDVVRKLLREVLAIQSSGDPERAGDFVNRYGNWDETIHGSLASNIRGATRYRYRLVRYAALGE